MTLCKAQSKLFTPGPWKKFRPALPRVYGAAAEKLGFGEHSGLNARSVAIDFDAAVIDRSERRVDLPAYPVSQGQVGPELELVLRVGVVSIGSDGLIVTAFLQIGSRYTEQEIRRRITGAVAVRSAVRKTAIVVGVENCVYHGSPHLEAELHRVAPFYPREVIVKLEGLVDARLGAVITETEAK